jgi:hypothetical protein
MRQKFPVSWVSYDSIWHEMAKTAQRFPVSNRSPTGKTRFEIGSGKGPLSTSGSMPVTFPTFGRRLAARERFPVDGNPIWSVMHMATLELRSDLAYSKGLAGLIKTPSLP